MIKDMDIMYKYWDADITMQDVPLEVFNILQIESIGPREDVSSPTLFFSLKAKRIHEKTTAPGKS